MSKMCKFRSNNWRLQSSCFTLFHPVSPCHPLGCNCKKSYSFEDCDIWLNYLSKVNKQLNSFRKWLKTKISSDFSPDYKLYTHFRERYSWSIAQNKVLVEVFKILVYKIFNYYPIFVIKHGHWDLHTHACLHGWGSGRI